MPVNYIDNNNNIDIDMIKAGARPATNYATIA